MQLVLIQRGPSWNSFSVFPDCSHPQTKPLPKHSIGILDFAENFNHPALCPVWINRSSPISSQFSSCVFFAFHILSWNLYKWQGHEKKKKASIYHLKKHFLQSSQSEAVVKNLCKGNALWIFFSSYLFPFHISRFFSFSIRQQSKKGPYNLNLAESFAGWRLMGALHGPPLHTWLEETRKSGSGSRCGSLVICTRSWHLSPAWDQMLRTISIARNLTFMNKNEL